MTDFYSELTAKHTVWIVEANGFLALLSDENSPLISRARSTRSAELFKLFVGY